MTDNAGKENPVEKETVVMPVATDVVIPPPVSVESVEPEVLLARVKPLFPRTGHLIVAWLASYERTESNSLANQEVGISHDTIAQWKKNEDFMALFTAAHLRAQAKWNEDLKASAIQRATFGNPHFLIRAGAIVKDEKGKPVIAYRDFETQLTMFMLKNRMPDQFKDKFEHEITGQILINLASEFSAILRKHVPVQFMPAIQKELETLSARLAPQS